MLAFKFFCLAATAPLLVPAAYVVGPDVTARELGSTLFVSTALEYFEPNATALEKRLSITDCIKIAAGVNTCFTLGNNIRAIGSSIGSWIKSRSDAHDCTVHTGAIDGVQWRYSATGSNCDSTAQLATIRGAIDAFLKENVNGRCSNICLRMTHGGTWTGYLSVTPTGSSAPPDCGTANYGSCELHGDGSDLGGRAVQRPRKD
ncbi:hypothetical protein FB451DRAFT_1180281 [Mycena latifolia]|nr:hypothetical protein FB451DRAFT_1180281 [Mycena latifolia]